MNGHIHWNIVSRPKTYKYRNRESHRKVLYSFEWSHFNVSTGFYHRFKRSGSLSPYTWPGLHNNCITKYNAKYTFITAVSGVSRDLLVIGRGEGGKFSETRGGGGGGGGRPGTQGFPWNFHWQNSILRLGDISGGKVQDVYFHLLDMRKISSLLWNVVGQFVLLSGFKLDSRLLVGVSTYIMIHL